MRIRLLALTLLLLAGPAWAPTVPVSVRFLEIEQFGNGIEGAIGPPGEYYAEVGIDGGAQSNRGSGFDEDSVFGGIILPWTSDPLARTAPPDQRSEP